MALCRLRDLHPLLRDVPIPPAHRRAETGFEAGLGLSCSREPVTEGIDVMERLGTILMVDDEPFILTATAQFLRSSGYEVHTCDQWMGVAAVVRSANPDVILMDYNMPGLKGDEMCRILKRNAASDLRIIIFSSEPEADLVSIIGECGADGYICKREPGHRLLRALSEHVDPSAVA